MFNRFAVSRQQLVLNLELCLLAGSESDRKMVLTNETGCMGEHHLGPAKLIISIQCTWAFVHSRWLINSRLEAFSLYQWLFEPVSIERDCSLVKCSHYQVPLAFWSRQRDPKWRCVCLALSHLRSSSEFPSYWTGSLSSPLEKTRQSHLPVTESGLYSRDTDQWLFSLCSCGAPAALEMWTGLHFPKDFSPWHP